MQRLLCLVIVAMSLTLVAANLYISQFQAITESNLQKFDFEQVADNSGRIGGPAKYKITDKAIEHLRKLQKDGKHIIAHPDGTITFE
jgi:hypothetical protein